MTADALLARLAGVEQRGAQRWVARCPAHKDRTPSLSIREESDGRLLLYDFGGCSVGAVLDALGLTLRDLFAAPLAHHLPALEVNGAHAHAARDAWFVLRYETAVVQIIADDIAAGVEIDPEMRTRMRLASSRIAEVSRWMLP